MNLKRLFISKNASEVEPYRSQFKELGYEVEAHSFLSFSRVEFELTQPYDVIFFGSPRAVVFFKAGFYSIPDDVEIACVGRKTAEMLESLGYDVAFCGEKSGEPKRVAVEFKAFVGERRVLFPVSDRSLGTISGVIDDAQKEIVVVYSTEVKGKLLGEFDVYVFTSPSNVEGFFEGNTLSEKCEVVAWGKSCEAALKSHITSSKINTLKNSSFFDLLSLLG